MVPHQRRVLSVIQITGVLPNLRDNSIRCERSHRLAPPPGRTQGETIMRKFIIAIAIFGALVSFAGSSAVTALSQSEFAAPRVSAHHQIKVNDTVRTVRPAHGR